MSTLAEELRQQKEKNDEKIKAYRLIDFQVDTIRADNNNFGVAYFSPNENTITSNYFLEKNNNEYAQSDVTLLHEQKHRDNSIAGMKVYAVSPQQSYKLNMHDEISATISELVYLRQKYIETKDINVFDSNGSFFKFYKDAVGKGEVNPLSNNQVDFDKDMALIANGTRDKWQKTYGKLYSNDHIQMTKYFADRDNKYAQFHDENYQRGKDIAYNIGGVDFGKYMNQDVEIPKNVKYDMVILEKNSKNACSLAKDLGVPEYDGSISLDEYKNLIIHQATLNNFLSNDPQYISGYVGSCQLAYNQVETEEEKANMQNELSFLGKEYKNFYDNLPPNIYQAASAVAETIEKEYKEQGKKIPKSNPQAYQQKLNELYSRNIDVNNLVHGIKYSGNVSLYEPLNTNLELDKISAEKFKNGGMSWKENAFRKYMGFCGIPQDKIDNMTNNLKKYNNKITQGALASLIGIGAPILGAGCWCVDKISGIGKGENKPLQNKPLHSINNEQPKYREWKDKDGQRVSEVMYRKLPDLTKDFIDKPSQNNQSLSTDNAMVKNNVQTNTNSTELQRKKLTRLIENLNKVNGDNKAVEVEPTVQSLSDRFGENAYNLALVAINQPFNYANLTGNSSIKTSRAAVADLVNIDDAQAQKILQYSSNQKSLNHVKVNSTSAADRLQELRGLAPLGTEKLIQQKVVNLDSTLLKKYQAGYGY